MLHRMFWISIAVMMIVIGSVMNTFAQEDVADPNQAAPGPGPMIPQSHAEEETIYALCGTGCTKEGNPDSCNWAPATGSPQQVCQAKKFCSVDGQGVHTCNSWWAEIDLGTLNVTGFTTQQNGSGPIEPAPAEIYQIISEAEMSTRIQPSRVRRTYDTSSPVNLQVYQHVYAADNHFSWLMCEVDTRGDDTACDVYQP